MSIATSLQRAVALSLCFCHGAAFRSAEKKATAQPTQPSYELPQPQRENLDLNMYQLIRQEGLAHSHVMEYASALADGIGPRLTGSPNLQKANEWTRDQLTAMGCANAHLEDWGEFGMGWQQLNTWIRMTSPDTAVLIAQAAPWSPSTNGAITAPVAVAEIKEEKDLDQVSAASWAERLCFSARRGEVKPVDKPLYKHLRRSRPEENRRVSLEAAEPGVAQGLHEAA